MTLKKYSGINRVGESKGVASGVVQLLNDVRTIEGIKLDIISLWVFGSVNEMKGFHISNQ